MNLLHYGQFLPPRNRFGAIMPGDALTSSDIPGYAVKATKPGPIIAKALEKFDGSKGDTGKILVFVDSGWYGGEEAIAGEVTTSKLAEGVTKAAPEAAGLSEEEMARAVEAGAVAAVS